MVVVFIFHVNRRERGFSSKPLNIERKEGEKDEEGEREREREREREWAGSQIERGSCLICTEMVN